VCWGIVCYTVHNMSEQLKNPKRRKFVKDIVATSAMLLGGNVLSTMSATEAEARRRLNKFTVHEVPKGTSVQVDLLLELDVPYDGWQEKLGGADTGVVISKKWHRMWFFKDGKLITDKQGRPFPMGSANTERVHDKDGTPYSTRTGLFHIGRKYTSHRSRTYGRGSKKKGTFVGALMHYAMFLKDAHGNDNAEALHGSSNFYFDKHAGELMVNVDSSHGCINGYTPQIQQIYKKVRHTRNFPVYILSENEEWQPGEQDREQVENPDEKILEQTILAERSVKNEDIIYFDEKEFKSFFNRVLPNVPEYDDLDTNIAHQIYGHFEHYSISDPVIKLLSGDGSKRGDAVRVDNKSLLTVLRKRGLILNNRRTRDALTKGKHKDVPIQNIVNFSEGDLHGTWATAFGYTYDSGWIPVRAAGVLVNIGNKFGLVTKDIDDLEQGMPVYARIDGHFQLAGVVKGLSKKYGEIYVHELIGPSKLRNLID